MLAFRNTGRMQHNWCLLATIVYTILALMAVSITAIDEGDSGSPTPSSTTASAPTIATPPTTDVNEVPTPGITTANAPTADMAEDSSASTSEAEASQSPGPTVVADNSDGEDGTSTESSNASSPSEAETTNDVSPSAGPTTDAAVEGDSASMAETDAASTPDIGITNEASPSTGPGVCAATGQGDSASTASDATDKAEAMVENSLSPSDSAAAPAEGGGDYAAAPAEGGSDSAAAPAEGGGDSTSENEGTDSASSPSEGDVTDEAAPSPSEVTDAPASRKKAINTAVIYICSLTDFRDSCIETLSQTVGDNPTTKDLVRGAVVVVVEAVKRAFEHADQMASEDPEISGAVDVCREVHGYIVDDLNKTLSLIDMENFSELPGVVNDLQTWLSAAIAYQETCVDGYPDGEIKDKMRIQMEVASEMTSNALAIVETLSTASSLFSILGHGSRRLLVGRKARAHVDLGEDNLPSWIHKSDRRLLYNANQSGFKFTPNVTVAKDGSGDFKTINESLEHAPKMLKTRYVIYVKAGVYKEDIISVDKKTVNITMYGDGPTKTVITGSKNVIDGVKTFSSASFGVAGDGFMAIDMGFENTAGPAKHQAVALRVNADRAVFLNCRMEAYQDTLYAHSNRQFYRDCYISGTVDFIFGDSSTILQNCILVARKPMQNQQNIFFAQGRAKPRENTGFVVQNCKFIAEPDLVPVVSQFRTYIGRPWKMYSHTIVMESELGNLIHPEGYCPMNGKEGLNTLTYAEYANTGPGANTSGRVKWPGVKTISSIEAREFTIIPFIEGQKWIPSGIPMQVGFYNS